VIERETIKLEQESITQLFQSQPEGILVYRLGNQDNNHSSALIKVD
jgi:hypothetical protein